MLQAGTAVPDVGAPDQNGNDQRLRGFAGSPLVVYFYPKADTPGCTAETQAFEAGLGELTASGAKIVGVIVEKNMYGKKSMGLQRSTFLFGADGVCVKAWTRVTVEGHAKAVLEAVQSL